MAPDGISTTTEAESGPTAQRKLRDFTTMRVGGPADHFVVGESREEILEVIQQADASETPLLIVGGGTNLVMADEGYRGIVLQMGTTGISATEREDGTVWVTIEAGHEWDKAVAWAVEENLGGLEALSGIPGSTGATPVQNVGAYGADVSQSLVSIEAWDRQLSQWVMLGVEDLELSYRDSALKRATTNGSPRWVVFSATFVLTPGEALPVAYEQLARALDVELGTTVPLADVRDAVLRLRRSKGMVLDSTDPDTNSCGSFFMNPVVEEERAQKLPEDAPRYPAARPGFVKLSAAWLIDHAGYHKGFGMLNHPGETITSGRAALSSKHTLAVTNQESASCADVLALARAVRTGVFEAWGIQLDHEPLLIGNVL